MMSEQCCAEGMVYLLTAQSKARPDVAAAADGDAAGAPRLMAGPPGGTPRCLLPP